MSETRNRLIIEIEGRGSRSFNAEAKKVIHSIHEVDQALDGIDEGSLTSTIKPTDIAKITKEMDKLEKATGEFTTEAKQAKAAMQGMRGGAPIGMRGSAPLGAQAGGGRRPQPPLSAAGPPPSTPPPRRPPPGVTPGVSAGAARHQQKLQEMSPEELKALQDQRKARLAMLLAAEQAPPQALPDSPFNVARNAALREAEAGGGTDKALQQLHRERKLFQDEMFGYTASLHEITEAIDADKSGGQAKRLASARQEMERKLALVEGYLVSVGQAIKGHGEGIKDAASFFSEREAVIEIPDESSRPHKQASPTELEWKADRFGKGGDGESRPEIKAEELRAEARAIRAEAEVMANMKATGKHAGGTRPPLGDLDVDWDKVGGELDDDLEASMASIFGEIKWDDASEDVATGVFRAISEGIREGVNEAVTGKHEAVTGKHEAVTGKHEAVSGKDVGDLDVDWDKVGGELDDELEASMASIFGEIKWDDVSDDVATGVFQAIKEGINEAVTGKHEAVTGKHEAVTGKHEAVDGVGSTEQALANAAKDEEQNERKIMSSRLKQVELQKQLAALTDKIASSDDSEEVAAATEKRATAQKALQRAVQGEAEAMGKVAQLAEARLEADEAAYRAAKKHVDLLGDAEVAQMSFPSDFDSVKRNKAKASTAPGPTTSAGAHLEAQGKDAGPKSQREMLKAEFAVAMERSKVAAIENEVARLADKTTAEYNAQMKSLREQNNIQVSLLAGEDKSLQAARKAVRVQEVKAKAAEDTELSMNGAYLVGRLTSGLHERDIRDQVEILRLTSAQNKESNKQLIIARQQLAVQAELESRLDKAAGAERLRLAVLRDQGQVQAKNASLESTLADPSKMAAAAKQAKLQQQLRDGIKESNSSFGDSVKGAWSSMSGFIGPFSALLQTGISFAWYIKGAVDILKTGIMSKEIRATADAMRDIVDSSKAVAASGGLLSGKQAAQLTMRGTLMGQRGGDNAQTASIAKAVAQMKVLTGEADDLSTAMAESMRQVQDELRSGEVGDALKLAGVHAESYQQALRQEAARRGILVESLDEQTKSQILLAQSADDAKGRLNAFRMEGLEGLAHVEHGVEDFKNRLAEAMTGRGEDGLGIKDLEGKRDSISAKIASGEAGSSGGQMGAGQFRAEGEIKKLEEQIEQAKVRAKQMTLDIVNQDAQNFLKQFAVSGEAGLDEVEKIMEGFKLLHEEKMYDARSDQSAGKGNLKEMRQFETLTEATAKQLDELAESSSFFSEEMLEVLRSTLSAQDAQKTFAKLQAVQGQAVIAGHKARIDFIRKELELETTLTQEEKARRELQIVELEGQVRLLELGQMRGLLVEESLDKEIRADEIFVQSLDAQGKALEIDKQRHGLLSNHEKLWQGALGSVVELRKETFALRDETQTYHTALGQAAAQKYFEKMNTHIEAAGVSVSGLVRLLGAGVGAMDQMAGGALLTDERLARLFLDGPEAKEPPKKGKTQDDDFLKQMRRKQLLRQMDVIEQRENAEEQARAFVETYASEAKVLFDQSDLSSTLASLGGDPDLVYHMDVEAQKALIQLAFTLEDAQEKYKDNEAKLKAAHVDFLESADLIGVESSKRRAERVGAYLKGQWDNTVADGKFLFAAAKKEAEAWAKEYEYMQQKVASEQKSNVEKMMLDSATSDSSGLMTGNVSDRKLTDNEKDAQLRHANMARELEDELAAHRYSADQKIALEQTYQAKLLEIEREYNQLRVDENSRLRQQNIAIAEEWLAESQALMAKFSDEARSQSEAGQATFQGGMSEIGKDAASGLDIATVSLMGMVSAFDEVEKAQVKMQKEDANGVQVWAGALSGALAAGGKFADGVIKDEKKKAAIKGAVHSASAIGEYAGGNIVGGTMHALAAAKFFTIAGSASAAPAKAKKAEATKKTALSATTVALSRDRGPTAITNVFIQMQPIDGRAMVSEMNRTSRTTRGTSLDARLMRPTATIRTDL